jgi:hypothetical protein
MFSSRLVTYGMFSAARLGVLVLLVGYGCGGRDGFGVPGPDAAAAAADAAAEVSYRAEALPTALNRIAVEQSDPVRDLCTLLVLVEPAAQSLGSVELPAGWGIERGVVVRGSERCAEARGGRPGPEAAAVIGASGAVGFDRVASGEPCGIDLDVRVETDPAASWAPPSLELRATDVPIFGLLSCLD